MNIEKSKANVAVDILYENLNKICKGAIPRRRGGGKSVPWWNQELTKCKAEANKAKKQMLRAKELHLRDVEDYTNRYKRLRNVYVAKIKKEKIDAWKNLVTTVGNEDPWRMVYKIVCNKREKFNYICSLTTPNG